MSKESQNMKEMSAISPRHAYVRVLQAIRQNREILMSTAKSLNNIRNVYNRTPKQNAELEQILAQRRPYEAITAILDAECARLWKQVK